MTAYRFIYLNASVAPPGVWTYSGRQGLNSSITTLPNFNIGIAHPQRVVVAAITFYQSTASNLTGVAINGITATRAPISSVNNRGQLYYARVPTGSLATVTLTFDTPASGGTTVAVYYGYPVDAAPLDLGYANVASGGLLTTPDIRVKADGVIIALCWNSGSDAVWTWGGSEPVIVDAHGAQNLAPYNFAHVSLTADSTANDITADPIGTGTNILTLAAWGGPMVGNLPPTDIIWSGSHSVDENANIGVQVGGPLSAIDPDPDDTFTYELIDTAGGKFALANGNTIVTAAYFAYTVGDTYNITVRVTDFQGASFDKIFLISVNDVAIDGHRSWFNELSYGDRTSLITVTTTALPGTTALSVANLIDGATGDTAADSFSFASGQTLREIKFDLGFGNSAVIDAFRWGQNGASSHGIWVFEGSNDDSAYTQLGDPFTLGGNILMVYETPNSTAYRYYKLRQTSGSTVATHFMREINFHAATGKLKHDWQYEEGNRSARIVVTSTASNFSTSIPNNIINGSYSIDASGSWAFGAAETLREIKFDFGGTKIVTGFQLLSNTTTTHGSWLLEASNDDSSYTQLGSAFSLGGIILTSTFVNTTAYRYYKLRQTSGSTSSSPWMIEIYFKILDAMAPYITSDNTAIINTGTNLAKALTADQAVTWSIVGGADQAQFEISGSTLRWSSNGVRSYNSPADADANNAYIVIIRATGASGTADQTITVTVSQVDVYAANVVLLVNFDGLDGATTAIDDSSYAHPLTFVGNAQLDTAQSKFGGSSLLLDGTGDYVTAPDHAVWTLVNDPFTVELFVRYATVADAEFISQWDTTTTLCGWKFGRTAASGLVFNWYDAAAVLKVINQAWTPVANTWYHVAATRDAAHMGRLYVDGTLLGSAVFEATVQRESAKLLSIGRIDHTTPRYFNGWIDGVRVTKGIARYTGSSFTVPPASYPPMLPPSTSYANVGGTGNRTSIITVTSTCTLGLGTNSMLVNGTLANEYWWAGGQSGREVVFDFGVGASKIIDEFKWYQDVGVNHGTWVFGGSNDGFSYTEFPESFLLGNQNGADTEVVTNSTGYRYYRLRQIAGVNVSTPYIQEIQFKIRDAS